MGFAARDGASKWRPESASLGTAPISRRRIFLQKKRKIDSFPSLILPKKCEKRECRRAKMASQMWNPPGRGHFSAVIFVAEKKNKKEQKNVKLKKGLGHGGIRRSCLRSQSKRSETQKTEFALGNHIKNTFFERNKHELKKL